MKIDWIVFFSGFAIGFGLATLSGIVAVVVR